MLLPPGRYSGLSVALRFSIIFGIFPCGFTFGMILDRFMSGGLIQRSKRKIDMNQVKKNRTILSIEDIIRISIIAVLIIVALPWFGALLGITKIFLYQPVHIGEHHGYYGFLLVFFALLETKIIKYYQEGFGREIILFGFTCLAVWGVGWILNDFLYEQFAIPFPFYTPFLSRFNLFFFIIQVLIIIVISLAIYYILWRKFYFKRISACRDF